MSTEAFCRFGTLPQGAGMKEQALAPHVSLSAPPRLASRSNRPSSAAPSHLALPAPRPLCAFLSRLLLSQCVQLPPCIYYPRANALPAAAYKVDGAAVRWAPPFTPCKSSPHTLPPCDFPRPVPYLSPQRTHLLCTRFTLLSTPPTALSVVSGCPLCLLTALLAKASY